MLSKQLKKKLDGISDCSIKGDRKVTDLFKIMVNNFEIWDIAHQRIAANKGATTKGVSGVTVDGYSDERVHNLIGLLKCGKYHPNPVRRTYIPKANGKRRPLGIPDDPDKLVQEVCRILLEAVYEPIFSKNSYGFRPKRGAHHALVAIQKQWTGTKWFMEFDIEGFFDNLNHQKMMELLSKKIDDDRFLALIRKILKAGYLEDWVYHKTYSGTPQGGVISPMLSNIYLHELDVFMNELCVSTNKGKERKRSRGYMLWENRIRHAREKIRKEDPPRGSSRRKELLDAIANCRKQLSDSPFGETHDENFRRLNYVRYADDFALGYIGSKEEGEKIMETIRFFLKNNLSLDCSEDKTKIAHHEKGIRFLGYDIHTKGKEYFKKVVTNGTTGYRRFGTKMIHLWVPQERMREFCDKHNYGCHATNKPTHRGELLNGISDTEIVATYNQELRGIARYYRLATNYSSELWRLHYIADYSLRRTLASKYRSSVKKISQRFCDAEKRITVSNGVRTFRLMKINDISKIVSWDSKQLDTATVDSITAFYVGRNDLTKRRKEETCEYCGTKTAFVEEHHIRALKDIRKGATRWERLMMSRNRKTLILCVPCHDLLHAGKLPDRRMTTN